MLDVDLVTAGLIGAVVGSTDAAAVFSTMRTTPLPRRTAALLRVESGSNDPIAVMLTVGLIATYDEGANVGQWLAIASVQQVGGGIVGAGVGMLAVLLLRRIPLTIEGLYPPSPSPRSGRSPTGSPSRSAPPASSPCIRHRGARGGAVATAAPLDPRLPRGARQRCRDRPVPDARPLVFPSQLPTVAQPALLAAGVLAVVAP